MGSNTDSTTHVFSELQYTSCQYKSVFLNNDSVYLIKVTAVDWSSLKEGGVHVCVKNKLLQ